MLEAKRRLTVRALACGEAPSVIVSSLRVGKSTVFRICDKIKNLRVEDDEEDIIQRKLHERNRPLRTPELTESVRQTVADDPSTSSALWRVTHRFHPDFTMLLHEDLGVKSY